MKTSKRNKPMSTKGAKVKERIHCFQFSLSERKVNVSQWGLTSIQ